MCKLYTGSTALSFIFWRIRQAVTWSVGQSIKWDALECIYGIALCSLVTNNSSFIFYNFVNKLGVRFCVRIIKSWFCYTSEYRALGGAIINCFYSYTAFCPALVLGMGFERFNQTYKHLSWLTQPDSRDSWLHTPHVIITNVKACIFGRIGCSCELHILLKEVNSMYRREKSVLYVMPGATLESPSSWRRLKFGLTFRGVVE